MKNYVFKKIDKNTKLDAVETFNKWKKTQSTDKKYCKLLIIVNN